MSSPVAQDGQFSAGPPQGKLAPPGGSAVHAVTSVGAAAAPGRPEQGTAPAGGSAVHAVTSVEAAAAPDRPKQGTAPSGGSAVHAVTSVGAISPAKEIILAEPRGFCAGVDRAIEIVERALLKFGAPIYVRHEIVHNTYVVNDLKAKGAIFIEELDDVPAGATLVFSAHGVSRAVHDDARARGFQIFDATCPLVTKVHVEVAKLHREGYEFIMIGHKGHPEVEGTMGQLESGIHLVEDVADVARVQPTQSEKLAVVTQTTLSVDDAAAIAAAVKARFPLVREPKQQDICYATQNRQDAVKLLSPQVDIVIVVGSPTSSNSNRLRELAYKLGTESFMVDNADELQPQWFEGRQRVGLTAGASAPEVLVRQVMDRIKEMGAVSVRKLAGIEETVKFPLPKGLRL